MNLILLDQGEIESGGEARLSDARADHLIAVLRVKQGDAIRVGILDGPRGTATVLSVADAAVDLRCQFEEGPPARPPVDLLLALPRPKVMRRLWAQLSALGVGRIILTNAEKVERPYFDTHILSPASYRPLLIEGLQQSRDTRCPAVSIHRRFRILVEDELDGLSGAGLRLVADPRAERRVADEVSSFREHEPNGRVLIAVGPEGGWNSFEIDLLEKHRFRPIGMGPRTLRTDTACLALMSLVHDALISPR